MPEHQTDQIVRADLRDRDPRSPGGHSESAARSIRDLAGAYRNVRIGEGDETRATLKVSRARDAAALSEATVRPRSPGIDGATVVATQSTRRTAARALPILPICCEIVETTQMVTAYLWHPRHLRYLRFRRGTGW
jgi:hypothetical protein